MKNIMMVLGLLGLMALQIQACQKIDLVNPKITLLNISDLEKLPQQTAFSWYNPKLGCGTFLNYENGSIGFCKVYMDELPVDLSEKEKNCFTHRPIFFDGIQHTVYIFACGTTIVDDVQLQEYFARKNNDRGVRESYHLACPLRFTETKPKKITIHEVSEVLKSNRVIFYTGAGISLGAGVHAMAGLERSLGICNERPVDNLTHAVSLKGEKALMPWKSFCTAAFKTEPTVAHKALSEIAREKNMYIFTENIDYLHERSGILPVRPTKQRVVNCICKEDLMELDAIICIGLSRDDRGFLAYYKMHNPKGKIIAIDLKAPSYLGSDDYFLKGNLQGIVPMLLT